METFARLFNDLADALEADWGHRHARDAMNWRAKAKGIRPRYEPAALVFGSWSI